MATSVNNNPPKQDLAELIRELAQLGDDAEELQFWHDIFDDLEREEQEKLFSILREEYDKLKSVGA